MPISRPIRHLRWYIAALLFIATVINYVDRQVFSILAPDLQEEIGWSELDYSRIVIAFQLSYAVMMLVSGRILDAIGSRIGFALSVLLWSLAEIGHAFARTPMGFGAARFFLGMTEAANFPAAVKTVSEWFPARDRALATGLFNSGVALGNVIAAMVVPWIALHYGWQQAFVWTGLLGIVWIPFWLWIYRRRHEHPRLGAEEAALIAAGSDDASDGARLTWRELIGLRQTWAYTMLKCLGDPIWWFYLFWLPKLLASEYGIRGTAVTPYLMAVFICADIGCLIGGWVSGRFIDRGWSVNGARKVTFAMLGAIMMPSVIAAGLLDNPVIVVGLIALACGAHQAWSTIVFTVASDLFPSRAAGSVAGFGGFLAGMVSIVTAELTGRLLNTSPGYYLPVFLVAAALYPISLGVFHLLSPKMERARV